ncbi:glycosyltransferase family 4 protein [Cellulomonas dongxiuzhuiae]|uniref:D-inositol 3-phosphate glycosyltransferase n=1 Tax=Cellulomonas dongxiuzhuiae TaxID=2819979 RepID=A0ABX8GNI2_9CELL|nr:glycosyltransferase family 4 protein [Cellulomonas dongxiuzhuiae]MBO3096361.1 glycosyltransferase family 4 protein [Cellulomonas dongxiuzhuiae]QWC16774.1 glycosyltransferase family 4 protein [Cellulomonas dongxiuzhuiae]
MTQITALSSAEDPWGAEQSLALILGELAAGGMHCTIIVSSDAAEEFFGRTAGVSVVRVSYRDNARVARWVAFLRAMRRTGRADAIIVASVDLYILGWVCRLTSGGSANVIADLHDTFDRGIDRWKVRALLLGFSRVIAISRYVATELRLLDHCRIVGRPTDKTAWSGSEPGVGGQALRVGVVGRLVPEKRLEVVIEAFDRLPQAELHVYGAAFGRDEGYAARIVQEIQGAGKGHFYHGRQEAAVIYSSIDVLVVANETEASGRTVVEAMSRGVPVVVPDVGGASEYIVACPGGGITWSTRRGPAALRECIEILAGDPDRLRSMGVAARAWANAERSPTVVARMYAAAIGVGGDLGEAG